jgi:4-hydroxybenzoate polyprenyltransferase
VIIQILITVALVMVMAITYSSGIKASTKRYGIRGHAWFDRMFMCIILGIAFTCHWGIMFYMAVFLLACNLFAYNPWTLAKLIHEEKNPPKE